MKKTIVEYFDAYINLNLVEFGQRAKKTRDGLGLSQQAVADLFNRTKQQISHWELGKTKIKIDDLLNFSLAFNVPIDYLLFGDDD